MPLFSTFDEIGFLNLEMLGIYFLPKKRLILRLYGWLFAAVVDHGGAHAVS